MKISRIVLIFTSLLILTISIKAQDSANYIVAFYNVENLFNPNDDSLKNDDAFTPNGFNHWTYRKYVRKINNISKVILAMGKWSPPDVIGLAEIEEASVLKRLCYDSPLKKYHYGYVHYDSPDIRGVDVALLYRRDRIRILRSRPIPVVFPFDSVAKNRDILYAVAQFYNGDSLHIFVNHWTSRYGGYAPTIPKRNYYASIVRHYADSLLRDNPAANIFITGDFNDYPTDESITEVLQCGDIDKNEKRQCQLYDLMYRFARMPNTGSHKHEDFWGCLDQIIVSSPLLDQDNPLYITNQEAHIFKADFMVEPDEKFGGEKVYRTFLGPRYIGGYADHLPVYVIIEARNRASP